MVVATKRMEKLALCLSVREPTDTDNANPKRKLNAMGRSVPDEASNPMKTPGLGRVLRPESGRLREKRAGESATSVAVKAEMVESAFGFASGVFDPASFSRKLIH
jgi:hypothetical protein